MDAGGDGNRTARKTRRTWIRWALVALLVEKIVQHVVVSLAFYFDWRGIRSTVAVNPSALMVLGAGAAVLFAVSLYGILGRKRWAASLVLGLAVFDLAGEFVAQGKIGITMTVSFLVAAILLVLALWYKRDTLETA
ncbi:MAG: hypothetical protein ACM30E_01320 [Nitrososphaerales archaeon]